MLSLSEAMSAWGEGLKEVLEPTLVLLLAWALGAVIADVGTATFLATSLRVRGQTPCGRTRTARRPGWIGAWVGEGQSHHPHALPLSRLPS